MIKVGKTTEFSTPGLEYSAITEVSYIIGLKDLKEINRAQKFLEEYRRATSITISPQDSSLICYEDDEREYKTEGFYIRVHGTYVYIFTHGKYLGELIEVNITL